MRILIAVLVAACGAKPPPAPPPAGNELGPPIALEWKAAQADGDRVDVSIIVDGKEVEVGLLDAATENEPGTPATCALRAAHPLRTELQCGAGNFYAVELHAGELVITLDDGEHVTNIKHVPVEGSALAVQPYAL